MFSLKPLMTSKPENYKSQPHKHEPFRLKSLKSQNPEATSAPGTMPSADHDRFAVPVLLRTVPEAFGSWVGVLFEYIFWFFVVFLVP